MNGHYISRVGVTSPRIAVKGKEFPAAAYSKRFLSILLIVCMLLAAFPTQAFAVESTDYTLTYTTNGDSTVTITGISVAEGFEEAELAVEIPETIDGRR